MKKKCIVVDLEGTLTNSDHRQLFLDDKKYDMWNAGLPKDKPNQPIIDFVEKLSKKYTIIISTAKPSAYRSMALDWLIKHAPFLSASEMHMRGKDDFTTSPQVKYKHIAMIIEKYDIELFIDDRGDVLKMAWDMHSISVMDTDCHIPFDRLLEQLKYNEVAEEVVGEESFTVADNLRKSADIFESRNAEYGSAYKDFGPILKGYFPNGITLEQEPDMNRFAMFVIILAKTQRYANNFFKGGHADSLVDMSTYCAMLNELDSEL